MHNLCHTTVYTLQYESTNKSLLNSYGQRSVVLCCGYGMNRTSRKPSEKYTNKSISVVWCVETECGVSARLAHAHIRMHQRIQLCSHKSRRSIFLVFSLLFSFLIFIAFVSLPFSRSRRAVSRLLWIASRSCVFCLLPISRFSLAGVCEREREHSAVFYYHSCSADVERWSTALPIWRRQRLGEVATPAAAIRIAVWVLLQINMCIVCRCLASSKTSENRLECPFSFLRARVFFFSSLFRHLSLASNSIRLLRDVRFLDFMTATLLLLQFKQIPTGVDCFLCSGTPLTHDSLGQVCIPR